MNNALYSWNHRQYIPPSVHDVLFCMSLCKNCVVIETMIYTEGHSTEEMVNLAVK